ncbi:unnamed protein product [Allacma fusca]|uniref:Uncharacterized protein n=1 Tax=Allacma fusca TaxID=39272 RepID=A0A8J2P055_9HEXA|nr:unnamed protein product [Allacma fusca]
MPDDLPRLLLGPTRSGKARAKSSHHFHGFMRVPLRQGMRIDGTKSWRSSGQDETPTNTRSSLELPKEEMMC